ncbi:MAG: Subtilisin E precursor [Candidatus Heimdallarchaeota archaeon LC_2]|nr:MAG: Subtilisin E precursor [Candidatus Heimdallarchaeota archaeon LC_2]
MVNSSNIEFNSNNLQISKNEIPKLLNQINEDNYNPYVTERDVVIFAEDDELFQLLHKLPYSRSYDTLNAIKIRVNQVEETNLKEYFPSIYPYKSYIKAQFPQNFNTERFSNFQINAIDDFTIMGVNKLWDEGYFGEGVVIGVIDNGVDFSHPDLQSREFASKNFTISGADISYSHGTGVAGAIVSTGESTDGLTGRGSAYGAKVAAANMGQSKEGFLVGDFLGAFDWLANFTEIKIINTSWSGGGEDIWLPLTRRLEQLNIIVIGAAGNEGSGKLNVLGSPANTIYGLSVAAVNEFNQLAGYSSEGPASGGFTKPDVTAPGNNILTTNKVGGYSHFSGTSFSAPLVSGAVATLISALSNKTIPYNVGLLKAALMKTSNNTNDNNELRVGQGLVNISKAFDLIKYRVIDNQQIPILSLATPTTGFFEHFTNLRQNIYTEIPFTLITSNASNVTISLPDFFKEFIQISPINQSLNSQVIWLEIDTTDLGMATYATNITIQDYFETIKIPISFIISSPPNFKVLFDLRHTFADNGYTVYRAGQQTGTFIELINQKGGWVDLIDSSFTSNLLSQYELIWLPDVFAIDEIGATNITSDEIQALQNYVGNGGNLFIHYFGQFNDSLALPGDNSLVGTNIEMLNSVISSYDMMASADNPDLYKYFTSESGSDRVKITNQTQLGWGIEEITTFDSTPIIISGDAISLAENNVIAKWSHPDSGRVIVSSTSSWFSSESAINDKNSNDFRFMENVINWFMADPRLEYTNYQFENNKMTVDLFVSSSSLSINVDPVIKIKSNGSLYNNFELVNSELGFYEFTFSPEINGIHNVSFNIGDEYLNFGFNSTLLITVIVSSTNNLFNNIAIVGIILFLGGVIAVFYYRTNYSFRQK